MTDQNWTSHMNVKRVQDYSPKYTERVRSVIGPFIVGGNLAHMALITNQEKVTNCDSKVSWFVVL